jgi:hypothetical protein
MLDSQTVQYPYKTVLVEIKCMAWIVHFVMVKWRSNGDAIPRMGGKSTAAIDLATVPERKKKPKPNVGEERQNSKGEKVPGTEEDEAADDRDGTASNKTTNTPPTDPAETEWSSYEE